MKIEKRLITDEGVTITFRVVDGKMAITFINENSPQIFTLNLASDEIVDFTREIATFFSENKGIKHSNEPLPYNTDEPLNPDALSESIEDRLDPKEPLPFFPFHDINPDTLDNRILNNNNLRYSSHTTAASTFNNPFKKS